jgi:membrane-bound lytic murein transglycosylase F
MRVFKFYIAGILALPFLFSGDDHPSQLQQITQRGSMTMLTRNGASSYYLDADGPTGPEYELVRQFSEFLGVELKIEVASAFSQLNGMLDQRKGDLIAANLTRTHSREMNFNFGPDYLETQILAVYKKRQNKPRSMADLVDKNVMILAGSSYEEALIAAQENIPELSWEARSDVGIEDLLLAVSDEAIDVTLVDSNIFSINKSFYPKISSAFVVEEHVPHAWAFRHGPDDSLSAQARAFILQARQDGRLAKIIERFYSDKERLDQYSMYHFLSRARDRLPLLIDAFREAGDANDIDWRLLAAIGYQESHWDPEAESYTGVRGIMMLTEQTAEQLGIDNRLDPEQSIDGGARYLTRLIARLPDRIPEPDRTWMSLAAYNMGMGHLRDARILTQKQGRDPDKWTNVIQSLDLLSQEKWHSQTQYGYARGFEAKVFVENIRRYYEILVWMDTREHPLLVDQLAKKVSGDFAFHLQPQTLTGFFADRR